MKVKPDKCPECGCKIEATQEVYLRGHSNGDGTCNMRECGVEGEVRFYCENDHDLSEVVEVLD